jgi:hypothetical protein
MKLAAVVAGKPGVPAPVVPAAAGKLSAPAEGPVSKRRTVRTSGRERSARFLPQDIQSVDRNADIHLLGIQPF